jgi:hypothetical protein
MRGRRVWAALVAVGVLAVAGACSGGTSDEGSADSAEAEATGGADSGDGGGGDELLAAQTAEVPERIVHTATLRLRVDDPAAAADGAEDVAEEAGGSTSDRTEEADAEEVTLTLRVPAEAFTTAVDDIADLGEVLDRRVSAEEVTDQVVDLEGRLANAEASAARLRELFAEAQDVTHVVALEQALTEREAEVESLQGQLQVLEDRADRSTIDLALTQEGEPEVDDDIPGFLEGLRSGWVAFRNVLAVAVTILGFLLPFLVPLAVAGLAIRGIARRRARRRPPRPPSGPSGPGAPPPGQPPPGAHPPAPPAPASAPVAAGRPTRGADAPGSEDV